MTPAARIALLRGVNVGGKTRLAMAALRDLASDLGLEAPRTLLNSGNLVFHSTRSTDELEVLLEAETARRLGVTTSYFVRTAAEWSDAIAANPFEDTARDDPGHLVLLCVKTAPAPAAVEALRAAIVGPEQVVAVGRQLYITYPNGIGRSKLTPTLIESRLGKLPATGRNWNSVLKLAAWADDSPAHGTPPGGSR